MTKTPSSTVPVPLKGNHKGLDVVTLPAEFGPVIAELSEVSAARGALEKREKELKAQLTEALPLGSNAYTWPRGLTVGLRVVGIDGLLAKVGVRRRSNISGEVLRENYPEAYQAAKSESAYLTTTTA